MSVFVVLPDACHAYDVTLRAAVSGVVTGLVPGIGASSGTQQGVGSRDL